MNVADYLNQFSGKPNYLTLPQHESWIKTKKSEVTGEEYQYNDIELIEDILSFFGDWKYEIKETHFVQDKFGISVTVEVVFQYGHILPKYIKDIPVNKSGIFASSGIASEFAPNTKYLTLATPKAASMAFKNAAKKIGTLLGKDLNRGIENNELPSVFIEKEPKQTTQQRVISQIANCKTTDELESYKLLSNSDEIIKKAYTEKYTEFIKENF
jgi:hypothetical protein